MTSFYSRASQRTVHIKELDTDTINPTTANYKEKKSYGSKVAIIGKPGAGKCLDPNTPVLLYDASIKKAKHIEKGDLLMGDDYKPREVLSTTSGVDEMYTITQSNGTKYKVNKPHILTLKDNNTDKSQDIPLSVLLHDENKTDLIGYKSLPKGETPLPVSAYTLGVWLGKKAIMKEESDHTLTKYITDNHLDYHPHLPAIYKLANNKDRYQLLQGLLQGNGGHYNLVKKVYNFYCYHPQMTDDLITLAASFNLTATVLKNQAFPDPNVVYHNCEIVEISTPILPSELNHVIDYSSINITSEGMGKYCGFELDGNGRFLLGDFTVTHNTTIIKNFAYEKSHIFPTVQVVSGTENENHFYKSWIPDTFIFDEYSHDTFAKTIERQQIAIKYLENPYLFCLWDDCTDDNKMFNHKLIHGLYKKGRHWFMLHMLSLQYCMTIKPVIRTNLDGTFLLRENQLRNRKSLFENFSAAIPDFRDFCDILDQVTSDFAAIYINNQVPSTKFEDCVFWYKAKNEIPDDWRFGCKEIWDSYEKRYDKRGVIKSVF